MALFCGNSSASHRSHFIVVRSASVFMVARRGGCTSATDPSCQSPEAPQRAQWLAIWFAGFAFWLLSLQGLRHAHSMMFLGWFALSGYLALYWIVFVYCARWFHHQRSLPIGISVAIAWIGQEVLRNYLLTGISACMLGHTMADVPVVIQFATWFGSYGVSLFVVMLNVVSYDVMCSVAASKFKRPTGTVDRSPL